MFSRIESLPSAELTCLHDAVPPSYHSQLPNLKKTSPIPLLEPCPSDPHHLRRNNSPEPTRIRFDAEPSTPEHISKNAQPETNEPMQSSTQTSEDPRSSDLKDLFQMQVIHNFEDTPEK